MADVRTKLGKGGRLVIPAHYRRHLGLKPGDDVILVLDKGEIRLLTPQQAVERAQALVRRYVPRDRRLSAELIRERREETRRA